MVSLERRLMTNSKYFKMIKTSVDTIPAIG
jgi:hypothetical protein